ncbi:CARDB domain-containing protein [Anaerolineales bacterium HSG25]|nr:CARDB domain-containing protein [Anaerolineales bacterium HSG25]
MKHQTIFRLIVALTAMLILVALTRSAPETQAQSFSCSSVTEIPQAECEDLLLLYNSTNGANWTDNSGWLSSNTPCSWNGVTCTEGHVTDLSFYNNQLSGPIPDFSNLPNLTSLSFRNNQLSGPIPDFSNLPKLWVLGLDNNQLSGNIPDFSNLPELTDIYLWNNQLSGPIPDFSNLPNLTRLWLFSNQLSGPIPDFSNLPNLTLLDFGDNQLSGPIPDFSNLPNLTRLGFDINLLPDFSNLSNLTSLSLYNMSGPIPDLSNLPNLTSLSLHNMSGPIPNFSNLPKLTGLFLSNNQLSGPIPDFSNLPNLTDLSLSNNHLSGSIPDFSNLPNLTDLSLSNNQLSGSIPDFSNLPNLRTLGLPNNQLSGPIPDFSNLPNLMNLYFSSNQLSGSIPDFSNLPNLRMLGLSNNQLSGPIPDFSNLPNLEWLYLDNNQLSGPVPDLDWTTISSLSLKDNCGLVALDDAQATVLSDKDSDWQQQRSDCATFQISPTSLTFNGAVGEANPAAQNITINNLYTTTLTWSASESLSWLSLDSASGTVPSTATVSVDTSGLNADSFTGTITFSSSEAVNSPQTVTVSLSISETLYPDLTVTTITDSPVCVGQSATLTTTVMNKGLAEAGTNSMALYDNDTLLDTLSVNPLAAGGTVSFSHHLTPTSTGTHTLKAIVDSTRIVAESDETNNSSTVVLLVQTDETAPTGSLSINDGAESTDKSQVNLSLTATDDGPCAGQSIERIKMRLSNDGTTWEAWQTYTPTRTWTLPSTSGIHTVYIQFQDEAGKVSQSYSDSITLSLPQPVLTVSPMSLAYNLTAGDAPISQTVNISNTGTGVLSWTASLSDSDLTGLLNLSGLAGLAPDTLVVTVDPSALTAGTYSATINISSNGGSAEIPVVVTVESTISSECQNVTQIPQTECTALVALYNGTNGDNWTDNSGWLQTDTPCSWFGIYCWNGHVLDLKLKNNSLVGSMPSELEQLTNLRSLWLHANQLSGPISPELGKLSALQYLYLRENQLTGEIPTELGNLSQLQKFDVGTNQLTGEIPAELGQLTQVTYLSVYANQLSGSVPESFGQLVNLQTLFVGNNANLSGQLPYSLLNLKQLQHDNFYYAGTLVCEPDDELFLAWLDEIIPTKKRTGLCNETIDPPYPNGLRPIDLNISLYKTASAEERSAYTNIVSHFADAVYEMSNGQHKLRNITIYQNGEKANQAEVLWVANKWPSANTAGYGKPGYQVYMGDVWPFDTPYNALEESHWKEAGYGFGHEWGHYYYGVYDEYRCTKVTCYTDDSSPHRDDVPVENSIMTSQWQAAKGDLSWLNFSVMHNYTTADRTAHYRVYKSSGWETIARPPSQDPPRDKLAAINGRAYFPELAKVAPAPNQPASIELPTLAGRTELKVTWVAPSASRRQVTEEPYQVYLESFYGQALVAPEPALIVARVVKEDPIAKAGITVEVHPPADGGVTSFAMNDDGVSPDVTADDGLYTGIMPYQQDGDYEVIVTFDNAAGTAEQTQRGYDFLPDPDGNTPDIIAQPVGEDFTAQGSLNLNISGAETDDHANSAAEATLLSTNNFKTVGQINSAGDVDMFKITPTQTGELVVRVSGLALGMRPNIQFLASDGQTERQSFTPQGEDYFYSFVDGIASESIYVAISHQDNTATDGLYRISAGPSLAGELATTTINTYLPIITK